MIDQTWISLISASTALLASVASPIVTLLVARQQFKANVLSANRQRWIETLREAVADMTAQLQSAAVVRQNLVLPNRSALATDSQLLRRVEELARTIAKIELLISPFKDEHRKLRDLMSVALRALRSQSLDPTLLEKIDKGVLEILHITQEIIKKEWFRVKRGT